MKNKIKKSKIFEEQLNNLINGCDLQIDVVYYILKATFLNVEYLYEKFLKMAEEDNNSQLVKEEIKIGENNEKKADQQES